jgi:hypothetical protein
MSFFTSGPMVLAAASPLQLNTLGQGGFDPKTAEMLMRAAGDPDPGYAGVMSGEPMFSVTAHELDEVLSNIGFNGKSIGSAGDFTSMTQYWTAMADSGDRQSGSVHLRAVVNKGMVIPTQLQAQQGNYATLGLDVHAVYDGTNAPVVWTQNVALPAGIEVGNLYTLGAAVVNGVTLSPELLQGLNVQFGVEVEKFAGSGEVNPRRVHVKVYTKSVTLETKSGVSPASYGVSTAFNGSGAAVYLRQMLPDGQRVPDATATHLKLTLPASQGIVIPQGVSGENNAAHNAQIKLVPRKGAAAILTFSLSAHP